MLDLLTLPFFQRALIIGVTLSILMAYLGVIVVLRKMSFFSDAIGHAALTGIAIGLLLQINPFISALVFSLFVATGIGAIRSRTNLSLDTLLGVLFSASVALGVILVQLTPGYQANLISFLFGDILTVSQTDVFLTLVITAIVTIVTIFTGKAFITIAFDPAIAKAEGIAVNTYELILLLTLAGVIAIAIKLVGVVLVTALLVIPAATAHNLTRSLASMFLVSITVSVTSVTGGLLLSAYLNTSSGPTIVLTGASLFAISLLARPLVKST